MPKRKVPDPKPENRLIPDERPAWQTGWVKLENLPATLLGPEPPGPLVESVKRFGVLQPVLLVGVERAYPKRGQEAVQEWRVLAGRRRVKAARAAKLTEVPALYIIVSDLDVPVEMPSVATVSENVLRTENLAAELKAVEEMLALSGVTEQNIAEATGLTLPQVRQRVQMITGLDPGIRALLDAGKLAHGTALAVAKLSPEQQAELVTIHGVTGRITGHDVRELRTVDRTAAMQEMTLDLEPSAGVERILPVLPNGADPDPVVEAALHINVVLSSLPGGTPVDVTGRLQQALDLLLSVPLLREGLPHP